MRRSDSKALQQFFAMVTGLKNSSKSYFLMKALIAFGGIFEAVMGAVILMWGDQIIVLATQASITPSYPLYWRTMGLLAITLGSLQVIASYQPERYLIIPLAACCVRFVLPILTVLQAIDTPLMAGLLAASTIFDFFLAVLTFSFLYYNGLLQRQSGRSEK